MKGMEKECRPMARAASQGGFILVGCLLFSLMIAAVAMYFTSVARDRIRLAQRVDDYATASLKAWSAYEDMVYVLTTNYFTPTGVFAPVSSSGPFTTDARKSEGAQVFLNFFGEPFQWGEGVRVTLRDESSLAPLVGGNLSFLGMLLQSAGLTPDGAERILEAILDWQDADNLKRLYGAEAWDYKVAGAGYTPRNACFQSLDELNLVLGMTKDLFAKIRPEMTFPTIGRGNLLNASPTLLRACFPSNENFVNLVLDLRRRCPADQEPLQSIAAGLPGMEEGVTTPDRVRIFVEASYGEATATIATVFGKKPTMRAPYRTFLWKR